MFYVISTQDKLFVWLRRMIDDLTISDILALQDENSSILKKKRAARRLSRNDDDDIREITAQTCVRYPLLDHPLVVEWLRREPVVGVRNYLYLALAVGDAFKSQDFLMTCDGRVSMQEQIYVLGALSIAFSSRMYQTMILPFIFSDDQKTSESAVAVARIITDEEDIYTLNYIDKLEKDAIRFRPKHRSINSKSLDT